MKKNPNLIPANFYGTPQTKFNLQGSGIRFPVIPKVKKGDKRNIYV